MFTFSPLPHDEAVRRIAELPLVSREVMDEMLPELKAYAFTITGLDVGDQMAKVRDMLAAVPKGENNWDKARAQIAAELVDDLGGKASERRAELLLRTHVFRGYAASRYRRLMQQVDVFPFWQYKTHGDGRVRPSHAALNGKIFPAGHQIWQRIFPPWDWGCRCIVVPLTKRSAEAALQRGQISDTAGAKGNLLKTQIYKPEIFTDAEATLIDKNERLPGGISLNRTPTWAAAPWSIPGNIRHDWPLIKARYEDQPEVLEAFEKWARKTMLPGQKKSIWTWVAGRAAPVKKKAKAALQEAVKAAAPVLAEFPADALKLRVVRKLGGSTGAELVEDDNSARWVRKKGASADHLREEVLADEIYRGLGAAVPEARLYETAGGPVKLARFVEGETLAAWLGKASAAQKEALISALGDHFHADVLLGNWDVIGLAKDNVLVDGTGAPWRIDNGGSLRFRAMGGLKGADWNAFPDELWSLRDKAKNAQTAEMFGDLKLVDIAARIEGAALPDVSMPAEVKDVLEARWKNMQDLATKALDMKHDGWRDEYGEKLCGHILGLRKAGLTADLPKLLSQAAGAVDVVDENGKPWDDLRRTKTAKAAAPADAYWTDILNAAKTLNHHATTGGFAYNKTKVAAALKHKAALEKLAKGKTDNSKMAKHYLAQLLDIESAQAASDQKQKLLVPNVSMFVPKPPPTAKPAKVESLVERLRDHIATNGGDIDAVTRWKGAQSGSSWSADAQAKKAWVARHMDVPAKDVWWKHGGQQAADALKAMEGTLGAAKVEAAFTIHHAFMQELLAHTEMRHNDRARRVMRLVRTEQKPVLNTYGVKAGQDGKMPRGLCESSSPFRVTSALSGTHEGTIQAVPHSRILGTYLMEGRPGMGDCGFLSDGENEFTFAAARVPFHYAGDVRKITIDMDAGDDATSWKLPLYHVRGQTAANPSNP